jgi:hypothetical protein
MNQAYGRRRVGRAFAAAWVLMALASHAAEPQPPTALEPAQPTAPLPPPKPWVLSASAGLEYDSNVKATPTELLKGSDISGKADSRGVFSLYGEHKVSISDPFSLGVNYALFQSLHKKLTEFDIQNHAPGAFATYQSGTTEYKLQYNYTKIFLGGSKLLWTHGVSPTVTLSSTPSQMTQVSYLYERKHSFRSRDEDANSHSARVNVFFFFDEAKGVVRAGGSYKAEKATGPQFDFRQGEGSLGVDVPLSPKFKISGDGSVVRKVFDNVDPTANLKRGDWTLTGSVKLTKELSKLFSVSAGYTRVQNKSNISSTDYHQNIASITLMGNF